MNSAAFTNSPSPVSFEDWGQTDYTEALQRQEKRLQERIANQRGDSVFFTEHAPVYTIGVRPGAAQHLTAPKEYLQQEGIQVVKTNRGGDITYHGPGQVVGYPIISLADTKDLHEYLRKIEEVLIRTVGYLGLAASRREGKTGIWMGERKIAAIGIAVRKWVTFHGFALNLNPRLDHFRGIVPCGITDGEVSSIERELGFTPPRREILDLLEHVFAEVFYP
ncbi:MAG: lipoyl(octanoyl) transferase LipB [Opitutales bacterium]|nr:lipoyl(octanoyl) transferase LipB [Opitutales bacterium]